MIQTKAGAENMKTENSEFDVYKDMQARTNGEIYIGVVGPVRTGKSTFIKRFMDVCVLPHMTEEYSKKQAVDELPQSGTGKTITTTEPKFIKFRAHDRRCDGKNEADRLCRLYGGWCGRSYGRRCGAHGKNAVV